MVEEQKNNIRKPFEEIDNLERKNNIDINNKYSNNNNNDINTPYINEIINENVNVIKNGGEENNKEIEQKEKKEEKEEKKDVKEILNLENKENNEEEKEEEPIKKKENENLPIPIDKGKKDEEKNEFDSFDLDDY